jgi:hypothetical protein
VQDQPTEMPLDDSRGFHPETVDHLIDCMKKDDEQAEEFGKRAGEKREELAKITAKLTEEAETFIDLAVGARARADQWRRLIAFARAHEAAQEPSQSETELDTEPETEPPAGDEVVVAADPAAQQERPAVGRPPYQPVDTAVMPVINEGALELYGALEAEARSQSDAAVQ